MYNKIYEFCKVRNEGIIYKNDPEIPTPRVIFLMNLLKSEGIEFELDQFSRQLYSTPNSRVENVQSAYSHFLYGDMPSAKESTPEGNMQRIKDNYRYTLY